MLDHTDHDHTDQLADRLRGDLLRPDDPDLDRARQVWNGMVDCHPTLIVGCFGTADVVAAINHARRHDLPLSVRGGGHSVAGKAPSSPSQRSSTAGRRSSPATVARSRERRSS